MIIKYFKSGTQGRYSVLCDHKIGHDIADKVFNKLNNDFPSQQFGALYNAYTEKNYSYNKPNPSVIEWISDSGGLQVITQGKEITPEIKRAIYKNQGGYSDTAMCFDAMPLYIDGVSSSVTDISNRYFLADINKQCGEETGANIAEQIKTFREMGSDTKVMLICQGNGIETYQEYFNGALSQIPEEYYDGIAGIAMADTANGIQELESADMIAAYRFLDKPKEFGKRLHLLGVGSLNRLFPALQLLKSGYLECELSYDSTTHSSLYIKGCYYTERMLKMGKARSVNSDIAVNSVYDLYGEFLDNVSREQFSDLFDKIRNMTGKTVADTLTDDRELGMILPFLFAQGSIYNFMAKVERAITENHQHKNDAINKLQNVKTCDDYTEWRSDYGRFLKSKRITSIRSKSDVENRGLSGFF